MKKYSAIIVCFALLLGLSACLPASAEEESSEHFLNAGSVYGGDNYLYDTLTIAGSGFGGEQTFTVYDLESLALNEQLELGYENAYSLMSSGGVFSVHTFTGLRLYDFLVYCGLDESLADDTPVKAISKDGYTICFTLGQIRYEAYSRYGARGDSTAQETGLPVIVAYAGNGVPLVGPTGDEPVYKEFTQADGYSEKADNVGGPLRLVIGQTSSEEFSAPLCSKWLAAIVVGDDNGYVYTRETAGDGGAEPEQDGDWTHQGAYADYTLTIRGTQARETVSLSLTELESMREGVAREYFAASAGKNAYEGVILRYLIEQYLDDGLDRPEKITVIAADGYSTTLDIDMVYDGVTSHYQPGKLKQVLLAYAIDGAALVESADSPDYNGENAFGPLRLVVENTISAWVKNVTEIVIGND